jgi:hypothetical protein
MKFLVLTSSVSLTESSCSRRSPKASIIKPKISFQIYQQLDLAFIDLTLNNRKKNNDDKKEECYIKNNSI